MALAVEKIIFKIEKGSKRPKSINSANSIFALYAPETLTIYPGQTKLVFLKYSIHHPDNILSTFLIMPSLRNKGLKLAHHTNVNVDQRIRLEFLNPTLKTFTLKKDSKIALFMRLNEGSEGLKKEFVKINKQ